VQVDYEFQFLAGGRRWLRWWRCGREGLTSYLCGAYKPDRQPQATRAYTGPLLPIVGLDISWPHTLAATLYFTTPRALLVERFDRLARIARSGGGCVQVDCVCAGEDVGRAVVAEVAGVGG